jgi:DNA polymerase IV
VAEPTLFHVDMDAFYASVEQHDNPALKEKPVIVGGTDARGVVSACSYEARRFGVHSAMPIFQAKGLCPRGIFVPVRMERYLEVSRWIMDILQEFSPHVQQISVDEAFLDMTGTGLLYGEPEHAAALIKKRIQMETGLTVSIGIGASKFIAKMASARSKPDGLFRVKRGDEIQFIDSCSLKDMWGIGEKALERLAARGITSPSQLRDFSLKKLTSMFGTAAGSFYCKACRGEDPGIFSTEIKNRSISNEMTFSRDISEEQTLRQMLFDLAHQVFFRTLNEAVTGRTACVKIKYSDFTSVTARKSFSEPFLTAEEFFSALWKLFLFKWNRTPVRLLGAGLHSIEDGSAGIQPELFESPSLKRRELEKRVNELRKKGSHIVKASSLNGENRAARPGSKG